MDGFIKKPDDILKILLLNVITKTTRTFIYYLKVVRSLQVGTDVSSISCLSRQSAQSRSQCTFLEMYLGQQTACSNSSVLPTGPSKDALRNAISTTGGYSTGPFFLPIPHLHHIV